ncbi:hypothetical protein [Streptomyces gobiensis]|uniref:hypothetical protein n=1 Tax=Streptomyces gobiensis TaxID=2875706 RepID=UPI001E2B7B36|nr:hypothetical protein [Streptomyces gobiensis]UGY93713.1 hypothetical protein test1122_19660 [Streptomyces gobiensis]
MGRTPHQVMRRRAIADASSGFQRTAVVIYVCVLPGGPESKMLQAARDYADARYWVPVVEVIDRAAVSLPLDSRTGWARVRSMIETGQAQGIVTATPDMCGGSPDERGQVAAWLRSHDGFAVYASTGTSPVEECGDGITTGEAVMPLLPEAEPWALPDGLDVTKLPPDAGGRR